MADALLPPEFSDLEPWLEDCGTLEATQMGLESRVVSSFPLGDQEFMCRHGNRMINNWVEDYKRKQKEG